MLICRFSKINEAHAIEAPEIEANFEFEEVPKIRNWRSSRIRPASSPLLLLQRQPPSFQNLYYSLCPLTMNSDLGQVLPSVPQLDAENSDYYTDRLNSSDGYGHYSTEAPGDGIGNGITLNSIMNPKERSPSSQYGHGSIYSYSQSQPRHLPAIQYGRIPAPPTYSRSIVDSSGATLRPPKLDLSNGHPNGDVALPGIFDSRPRSDVNEDISRTSVLRDHGSGNDQSYRWQSRRSSGPEVWSSSEQSSRKSSTASQNDLPLQSPTYSPNGDSSYPWDGAYSGRSYYQGQTREEENGRSHSEERSRRKQSFKTCHLEESGIDFPGCNVLVLSPGETDAFSEGNREPKVLSNRKGMRRAVDEQERAAIQMNRRTGVCLRCKKYKEKCRDGLPCERCRSLKPWKDICVPAVLSDKTCFGRGLYKARLDLLSGNLAHWTSSTMGSRIEVSNGFHPKLVLTAHHYVPRDYILLELQVWRDSTRRSGKFHRIQSTPYGLRGELSPADIDSYLDQHVPYLLRESKGEDVGDDYMARMYSYTLGAAYDYSQRQGDSESQLVQIALRIWAAHSVFFQKPWRICGKDTAGMCSIETKAGTIFPLPRLVGQQLDCMVEARIAALEVEFLAELQNRIYKHKRDQWFGTYLAIYIFVWGLEKDTWSLKAWESDNSNLRIKFDTYGLKYSTAMRGTWLWPLDRSPHYYAEKNHSLARILAGHFRSVTRGHVPFLLDWYSDTTTHLAAGQIVAIDYMRTVSNWVKSLDQYLKSRKSAAYSRDNQKCYSALLICKLTTED